MALEIFAVCIWGGLVALDTTAALQLMISQPLVACSVTGALLGNFPMGFFMGILQQLIWLQELPVGTAKFSEGNIGAVSAAAIAILATESTLRPTTAVGMALIISLAVSAFGGQLVIEMRQINGRIYRRLLDNPEFSFSEVTRAHLTGVGLAFALGFATTLIFTPLFGLAVVPKLISFVPVSLDRIFEPLRSAFLGAGCGVMIYLFFFQRYWWLLFAGLAGGALIAIFY